MSVGKILAHIVLLTLCVCSFFYALFLKYICGVDQVYTVVAVMWQSMTLLTAALIYWLIASVLAYPNYKTCSNTYVGTDENGVPIIGTDYKAMGAVWDQDTSGNSNIFQVNSGNLRINVESDQRGFFIISNAGRIEVEGSYTSECPNSCSRLECVDFNSNTLEDPYIGVPVTIQNDDVAMCGNLTVVVGSSHEYGAGILYFASIDVCDSNNIVVNAAVPVQESTLIVNTLPYTSSTKFIDGTNIASVAAVVAIIALTVCMF